ncbi:tRNA (m5U54) methyltransferase Trm2 [Pseudohyphozyma bogoriensis]|nr:tRNA (m5U54) methyltransferase Trm2 [Pseudohyphozyma bogoriensis]
MVDEPTKRAISTSPPRATTPTTGSAPPPKRAKLDEASTANPAIEAPAVPSPAPPPAAVPPAQTTTNEKPANPKAALGSNKKPRGPGKGKKVKPVKPGGAEETGFFDVVELLGEERVAELQKAESEDGVNWRKEAEGEWGAGATGKDVEVRVVGISAHGDGLGVLTSSKSNLPVRLVSIPFTLPGELVKAHIHRHEPDYYMSHADLVELLEKSPERDLDDEERKEAEVEVVGEELKATREKFGDRVKCKYFGVCSGCQYQPLSYASQLTIKQNVVRKAFANFSGLDASLIPAIGETLPSPLQYGYRTKLTPHFQTPPSNNPNSNRRKKKGKGKGEVEEAEVEAKEAKEWEVTIGFEEKGRKRIVDIEECVIATQVINDKLVTERERVKANISSYKCGATLLLRDSLPPRDPSITSRPSSGTFPSEAHVCITDHHAVVREQVGSVEFEQMAGSFFQNNNSILPSLLKYIADAVRENMEVKEGKEKKKRYLVDAYCGSGLFGVSLADQFDVVEGVEIDKASIKWAKKNAEFNKGEGRGEIGFRDGDAEKIFGDINFPSDQTTILIDPPRKGCDIPFLTQLLNFNPQTIIYVSCNVHTQARDIGWIVKKSQEQGKEFRIESLRAADLFANTHHAEGVAVLRRDV